MNGENGRNSPSVCLLYWDLLFVVTTVLLICVHALLFPGAETPLRLAFGLLFILFLPGYSLLAAISPRSDEGFVVTRYTDIEDAADSVLPERSIRWIETVILSFCLSISVVVAVGVVLNVTAWGIWMTPVLASVSAITLISTAIAAARRDPVPERRFRVRWGWETVRRTFFRSETRSDMAINVLLIASLLLAGGTLGYGMTNQEPTGNFSEFYLLVNNENGAELIENSPMRFNRGEERTLVLGIENHESRTLNYTIVAKIQEVERKSGSTTVLEEKTVGTFHERISAGEAGRVRYSAGPVWTSDTLRLVLLLYRGSSGDDPTASDAYRRLSLWISVAQGGATDGTNGNRSEV